MHLENKLPQVPGGREMRANVFVNNELNMSQHCDVTAK